MRSFLKIFLLLLFFVFCNTLILFKQVAVQLQKRGKQKKELYM